MEKRLITKSLVKKLQGEKQKKTVKNLEKRIKSSLLEQALIFKKEIQGVEEELLP